MNRRERRRPAEGPAWFAPKSHGYGSGLPIAWQGWVVLIGYVVLALGSGVLASRSLLAYLGVFAVLTAALLLICAKTTRGGWRWRWGEKDGPGA